MARDVTDTTHISSRDELVAWMEAGCKAPDQFRIGAEHEKIPFYAADNAPVPYEGRNGAGDGIRALLEGLQARTGWAPIMDGPALMGLFDEACG